MGDINFSDLVAAASEVVDLYEKVATGKTRGARGSYYADGKGTLCDISIPVEQAEALARALGRTVHPRVSAP